MKAERNIKQDIRLAVGKLSGVRLFPNPVGFAYLASSVSKPRAGMMILSSPRVVTFGLAPGSGDLIGMRQVVITQAMVGSTIAQFLSCEVKTEIGRPTNEQKRWLEFVNSFGGMAIIARSPEEATEKIKGENTCPKV